MKLETDADITWCAGCGNFSILAAFKQAVTELINSGYDKNSFVIVGGIGCHAKIMDYLNLNSFYGLHGRVVPVLTGIKIVDPNLNVIGFEGDGDAYDEGLDHLIHAAKRNSNIKLFVHDNQLFALTTGQFTATTPFGMKTKTSPLGSYEQPINPLLLMLAAGATFIARGYAGNIPHLKNLMKEAIMHKGFAFIDILQPCVTFNNISEYVEKRMYELKDHDVKSFDRALEKIKEWNDRIPIGVFYKVEKEIFEELI